MTPARRRAIWKAVGERIARGERGFFVLLADVAKRRYQRESRRVDVISADPARLWSGSAHYDAERLMACALMQELIRDYWIKDVEHQDLCFFTELKCNNYNENIRVLYGDNYFSVMPEQIVRIPVRIRNTVAFKGKKILKFSVGGWNAKVKKIGEVEIKFTA